VKKWKLATLAAARKDIAGASNWHDVITRDFYKMIRRPKPPG
jgi:hypothetical protein